MSLRSGQGAADFGGMSEARINNPVLSLAPSHVGILWCESGRGGETAKPLPRGPSPHPVLGAEAASLFSFKSSASHRPWERKGTLLFYAVETGYASFCLVQTPSEECLSQKNVPATFLKTRASAVRDDL